MIRCPDCRITLEASGVCRKCGWARPRSRILEWLTPPPGPWHGFPLPAPPPPPPDPAAPIQVTGLGPPNLRKPRPDLIPAEALLEVGRVLGFYADRPEGWREQSPDRHLESALRHILEWKAGRKVDPETGRSHLAYAAARLLYAVAREG